MRANLVKINIYLWEEYISNGKTFQKSVLYRRNDNLMVIFSTPRQLNDMYIYSFVTPTYEILIILCENKVNLP